MRTPTVLRCALDGPTPAQRDRLGQALTDRRAHRERNPRWFIEHMTNMGCSVVIETPTGHPLTFPASRHPEEDQVQEAVRLLMERNSAVLAEARRILDEEARRVLTERLTEAPRP